MAARRSLLVAACLALVFASLVSPVSYAASAEREARPNFVLVISDDHDFKHLTFLGDRIARTPALDRLAAGGTVFPVAHLPMSRCRPTLAALLSGRLPHQTGIYYNFGGPPLDPEQSLPNLLKQAGYATYVEGKYWERRPEAMGFTHGPGANSANFVRRDQDELLEFLDEVEQPFFVWYAPMIPHTPHNPPARHRKRFDPEQIPVPDWYQGPVDEFREKEATSYAMEAWLDDGVGEMLQKLHERGLDGNTMVIFLIDNGWANGLVSKGSPFEQGVRTPIVFHWPGRIKAGQSRPQRVSTLDVPPTILDYAGVKVPESYSGQSLRPLIEGEAVSGRETLFGAIYPAFASDPPRPERDVYALYARTERWKYILYLQDVRQERNRDYFRIQHILTDYPVRQRGDQDLYALQADPHELNNLADDPQQRQRLDDFRQQVVAWWAATGGRPLEQP